MKDTGMYWKTIIQVRWVGHSAIVNVRMYVLENLRDTNANYLAQWT